MRSLKIMLITLLLAIVSISSLSCASGSDQDIESESQVVPVQRGNLTIDITASGNLALSRKEELAFDLFYKEGTVEEVTVEESDSVEEGQVLARLDASEWDDNLAVLEDGLTTAQRLLTTKERTLLDKKRAFIAAERLVIAKDRLLTKARDQVSAKELALEQAEVSLQTAEYNLNQLADVKAAQNAVDSAEAAYNLAQLTLENAIKGGDPNAEMDILVRGVLETRKELTDAQNALNEILSAKSIRLSADAALELATKELAVQQAQRQVQDAQIAIDDAHVAVDDAQTAVDNAQLDMEDAQIDIGDARTAVDDARKDVIDAQEDLDEAKSKSPEVIATFDGFITSVNVEGGDLVQKGHVAVVLADPGKFEADVLVSEMDILQVKLGGKATVQVDAMQGVSLPAIVAHIAPTATIQQGVVNYQVKVEMESLESLQQEQQGARQEAGQKAMEAIAAGQLPERLRTAVEEGRMTQEQAEQIIAERIRQGGGQPGQAGGGQLRPSQGIRPEDIQLREGLTVTVNIIVEERNDVLLVPNKAITRKGTDSFVWVLKADDVIEERLIKTGISDYQNTEAIEGLSEGEKVVISQKTTTTPTTQQQSPRSPLLPGRPPMPR